MEECRLLTYIQDSEVQLHCTIATSRDVNPLLAHQLEQYLLRVVAQNDIHRYHLAKVQALDGYTGKHGPGVQKGTINNTSPTEFSLPQQSATSEDDEGTRHDEDEDDGKIDKDDVEAVENAFAALEVSAM